MDHEMYEHEIETHEEWALRITEQRRLRAYAHLETGSDRHFAEANRLEAMGQTIEAKAARDKGMQRYFEIRVMYPMDDDKPTPEIPQSVTRSQGKAALIQAGLWDAVMASVEAIEDETEQALALVAINDTLTWIRDSAVLQSLARDIGVTEQQMDDLFIAAAGIEL